MKYILGVVRYLDLADESTGALGGLPLASGGTVPFEGARPVNFSPTDVWDVTAAKHRTLLA